MSPEEIKKIRERFAHGKIVEVSISKTAELIKTIATLLDEVERCHAKLKMAEGALEQYAGFSPSLSVEGKTLELDCSFIAKDALKKIREA